MQENQADSFVFEALQLSCSRDDRELFKQLSFTLRPRQVLLLEGKNGSGKTSLIRLLCGFRQPDAGAIHWCGESIENNNQFFAEIAYVGHLDGIKKELTVQENLDLARALAKPGSDTVGQALDKVRMAGYEDMRVGTLSAGQKRRIAFARLLVTANRLWILDEPFTALDRDGIGVFERLMAAHISAGGMIILTSHHDINLHDIQVQQINLG